MTRYTSDWLNNIRGKLTLSCDKGEIPQVDKDELKTLLLELVDKERDLKKSYTGIKSDLTKTMGVDDRTDASKYTEALSIGMPLEKVEEALNDNINLETNIKYSYCLQILEDAEDTYNEHIDEMIGDVDHYISSSNKQLLEEYVQLSVKDQFFVVFFTILLFVIGLYTGDIFKVKSYTVQYIEYLRLKYYTDWRCRSAMDDILHSSKVTNCNIQFEGNSITVSKESWSQFILRHRSVFFLAVPVGLVSFKVATLLGYSAGLSGLATLAGQGIQLWKTFKTS